MMGYDAAAYQQLYQAAAYQQVAQAYAGMQAGTLVLLARQLRRRPRRQKNVLGSSPTSL